jgi:hypothetical protein
LFEFIGRAAICPLDAIRGVLGLLLEECGFIKGENRLAESRARSQVVILNWDFVSSDDWLLFRGELSETFGFSIPRVVLGEGLGEFVVIEVVVDDVNSTFDDALHVFRYFMR